MDDCLGWRGVRARRQLRGGLDLGCVALEEADIEELYALVPVGTPTTIAP